MAGKSARIDFSRCNPKLCDPERGMCAAVAVCKKRLLEQEERYDTPWLLSVAMCVGCGDCVRACLMGAISIDCSS